MKKIIVLIAALIMCVSVYSQIRITNGSYDEISGSTPAFIDASTNLDGRDTLDVVMRSKGLIFPRVNLTVITTIMSANPNPNNFSSYFDGMVVYNIGTGNTQTGREVVSVKPGFYYYENKTDEDKDMGIWKPLGGDCDCCSAFEIASLDCDAVSSSIPTTAFTEGESGTELATLLYLSKIGGDAITLADNQSLGSAYGLSIRVDEIGRAHV